MQHTEKELQALIDAVASNETANNLVIDKFAEAVDNADIDAFADIMSAFLESMKQ